MNAELLSFRDMMDLYRQQNKINSDFVRRNFIEIDTYFAELRREDITESKAYEVADFLGLYLLYLFLVC